MENDLLLVDGDFEFYCFHHRKSSGDGGSAAKIQCFYQWLGIRIQNIFAAEMKFQTNFLTSDYFH